MPKQGSTNTNVSPIAKMVNREAVEDQIILDPDRRRKAGHYEILGETHAKYEFFHNGWNPYSRFLNVDKVDLVLRRTKRGVPTYREVQVKFGKLYGVKTAWECRLFDLTSWRFFKKNEFDGAGDQLFIAYVLAADDAYVETSLFSPCVYSPRSLQRLQSLAVNIVFSYCAVKIIRKRGYCGARLALTE